jgi:tRNA pseudouridine55 synthase
MDGVLVIDKPAGPTSHDVVARLRRVLRERRIGHTGTLDPAATGVLPLVVGRATRLARFLSATDKRYDAVVRLGVSTDTYDAEGAIVGAPFGGEWPSRDALATALDAFRGRFLQQPPAYSAKKISGTRAYVLARRRSVRGTAPETNRPGMAGLVTDSRDVPDAVTVTVHALELLTVDGDRLTLRLVCSAGFYVRSLAHDLGLRLGTGAHLAALRRTRSGEFGIEQALPLALAERDRDAALAALVPLDRMLGSVAAVVLTEKGARHAASGRDLGPDDVSSPWPAALALVRLVDPSGHLVGIGNPARTPGFLHPSVVLG